MKIQLIIFTAAVALLATAAHAQSTIRTYTDAKNSIRFQYASDFVVVKGTQAKIDTAFGDPGIGSKLFAVRPAHIPARYHGSYEFNVWVSNGVSNCGAVAADESIGMIPVGENEAGPTRNISTATFYSYTGSEAGMSKSLGLKGYRTIINAKCWMIQSVTYQVSAFDDYKEFDDKIIDRSFGRFVDSFRFLNK